MSHYYCDHRELNVYDKTLKQKGTLLLVTRIKIRGNPRKGPVPVSVEFLSRFTAREECQEIDPIDGEVNWSTYERTFERETERKSYVDSFFRKI